jgi:hypothetical protein
VLLSLCPGPTQHFALCHATVPKRRSRGGPGPKYVTYFFYFQSVRPLVGGGEGRKNSFTGARTRSRRLSPADVHAGIGQENKKYELIYGCDLRNRDTTPEFASRDRGKSLKTW